MIQFAYILFDWVFKFGNKAFKEGTEWKKIVMNELFEI